MKMLELIRRHPVGNILLVFVVVQITCIVAGLLYPNSFGYLTPGNVQVMLKAIPPLAIMVIGVNILMIAGEFDLSVGSCFAFAGLVMASAFNAGSPLILALALALMTGAFIGWLNGVITVKTRIPSFIATLGALMFWRGMILWISGEKTTQFLPATWFENLFNYSRGLLQAQFVWLLILAVGGYLLLERHSLGNHFYGVGGNRDASLAVGLNPDRVKILAFVLAGMAAALAGVISATRVHSVSPIQGKGMELQAIAACVIGGTSLAGGKGSVLGPFLGTALIYTIQDVLLLVKAPGSYLEMFMGVLIVAAVVVNQLTSKK